MNSLNVVTFTAGMPDIANQAYQQPQGTLDWVGMAEVHQPFLLEEEGAQVRVHGRAQIYVDLGDPQAKGIHMSRLYLHLQEAAQTPLTPNALRALLDEMLASHAELSTRAFIEIRFDHFVRRPALKSDNSGWNSYPIRLRAQRLDGETRVELGVDVTYSSTCPCSAALARQLIQRQFESDFGETGSVDAAAVHAWLGSEQGIVATPHSQRSVAQLLTRLEEDATRFPITELIDEVEGALKTPVQAAVKREDEQEFARLNGQNLMFCEDAARRIKATLLADASVADFWVRVNHYESLHGHDAVAVVTAGLENGYRPIP
ncbi:MAG: GTP cyclohydrolase FolE2 [Pseudomonadales bacterium]|jgi:GTP cyclohydrolase I|nr:GTP cyclohydrolase FolE2 [Pseudomonadales bacterium]